MSDTQIIPISNLPALRGQTDQADKVAQLEQYVAAQTGLAELALIIEEEARASGEIKDGVAIWRPAVPGYQVVCTLGLEARKLTVSVLTAEFNGYVLRDDDWAEFVFNCPKNARWPIFLKDQHGLASARRAAEDAQRKRAIEAQVSKQQAAI